MAKRKTVRKSKAVIKTVSFRANLAQSSASSSLERYQHLHIEATADVPAGEDPRAVLDDLKVFVAQELKVAKEGETPKPQPAVRGSFRQFLS